MSLLFTCPHCRAYKSHHEPIGDKTNVRACPECKRFFFLWWTVKDARMFGVEPVMTGIKIGYPGTKQEGPRFATGGFTSDRAWKDEAEKDWDEYHRGQFFFGSQSPFFTATDPNGPKYEQEMTLNFDDIDKAHTEQILKFTEFLKKAKFGGKF